eukprot:Opistho-1_new@32817
MSAASCACSPTCHWTRSPGSKRLKAPRSTRRRRSSPPKLPPCAAVARPPKPPPRPREKTFEEGTSGDDLPTLAVPAEGMGIVQANTAIGFATSNKEVKRKIEEGAIRVNGEKVSSLDVIVKPGDKISYGQKKHGLIVQA